MRYKPHNNTDVDYGNISVRYEIIRRLHKLSLKKIDRDNKRPSIRELAAEALEKYLQEQENK
jgi:hypothetical protein